MKEKLLSVVIGLLLGFCISQQVQDCKFEKRIKALESAGPVDPGEIVDQSKINHFVNGRAVCAICQMGGDEYVENCHLTPYADGRGVFVLCEKCWHDTDPEKRLPYYHSLVTRYWPEPWRGERWPAIKEAVLAGK